MNKKAQGLSITVIIVCAIILVVLVILSIIFIGRMGKEQTDCEKVLDCIPKNCTTTGNTVECGMKFSELCSRVTQERISECLAEKSTCTEVIIDCNNQYAWDNRDEFNSFNCKGYPLNEGYVRDCAGEKYSLEENYTLIKTEVNFTCFEHEVPC